MKSRIIIAVCVLAIGGYLGYSYFMTGGAEVDEKGLRNSFQTLSLGVVSKNRKVAQTLVSSGFTDKMVSRDKLLDIMTLPRNSYQAKIVNVNIQGDLASVFYVRTESRGEDSPVTSKINGETWMRDKANKNLWRLHRLAKNDKGFRTEQLMAAAKPKKKAVKKQERVLGSLEKAGMALQAKTGDRYSAVGKRDPFRPLIALASGEDTENMEMCDPDRPREVLENFDLLSLKLSGVIITSAEPLAMVKAPDGKGHTIRLGMFMGKACGKVVEIEQDFLLVLEQKRKRFAKPAADGSKESIFVEQETVLKLRPEEG
jgi:Tfp pilus assembly protein PilP